MRHDSSGSVEVCIELSYSSRGMVVLLFVFTMYLLTASRGGVRFILVFRERAV